LASRDETSFCTSAAVTSLRRKFRSAKMTCFSMDSYCDLPLRFRTGSFTTRRMVYKSDITFDSPRDGLRWTRSKLDIEPETALKRTNRKFRKRFSFIEKELKRSGKTFDESSLLEMDALWNKAKAADA